MGGGDASEQPRSISLGVYCAGLLLIFGYRTFAQLARTRSSGWVGVPKDAGAVVRLGAALFALALLAGAVALWSASNELVPAAKLPAAVGIAGLALELLGLVAVVVRQDAMGDAWRIGVDPNEKTTLVTTGPFGRVRNPIFSAMIGAQIGVLLVAPNVIGLAATLALVISVQIQVRICEEPYLLRTHAGYRRYAARVGRFMPGIGRIES